MGIAANNLFTFNQHLEIAGKVNAIIYDKPLEGYYVFKIADKNSTYTITGNIERLAVDDFVTCKGFWVQHKTYGRQFKALNIAVKLPQTVDGIKKYLASGLVKGIGPARAKAIVDRFGEKTFEIIELEPERLLQIPRIGKKNCQEIYKAIMEQKDSRDIMAFLHTHEISSKKAIKIYRLYGKDTISIITKNPYQLIEDISGIGFKIADKMALSIGIAKDSTFRVTSGVKHVLGEFQLDGNCAMPLPDLLKETKQILGVEEELIYQAITSLLVEGQLVKECDGDKDLIFLKHTYTTECRVAKMVYELNKFLPIWHDKINIDEEVEDLQKKLAIQLSESQVMAVKAIANHKITIITGGPGVGKTTVANSILQIVSKHTSKILLAAPTGKAAKRLKEATGREATTLHRMLKYTADGGFEHNSSNKLDAHFILLDEVSMIDIFMFANVLQAIPSNCVLILLGDADQLPSIGPGNVLGDLITSGCVECIVLNHIFRQDSCSQIVKVAHNINNGIIPTHTVTENPSAIHLGGNTDFYLFEMDKEFHYQLTLTLREIKAKYKCSNEVLMRSVQVLSPMKRGDTGVEELNKVLQKELNPNADDLTKITSKTGDIFTVGDKVMQNANDYGRGIFNGNVGIVHSIDLKNKSLLVDFDAKLVKLEFDDLEDLRLAYAITIHKCQGSEYPVVIIPVCMDHYKLLQKRLIYTAVTRGRKMVIMIAESKALAMAIKNFNAKPRVTMLKQRVIQQFNTNKH